MTDSAQNRQACRSTTNARFLPDTELYEFICNENEKSRQHMGPNIK